MPFSLSVCLYKMYQEKVQQKFEENNKILNINDLESLFTDPNNEKTIQIFNSAIVDHHPVDGIPYYLAAPLSPLFYHDHFKRCLIANAVGEYAHCRNEHQSKNALAILDKLIKLSNAGYVQIFAWNALAKWGEMIPELFETRKNDLTTSFGGSTASVLGAVLFLDTMIKLYPEKKNKFWKDNFKGQTKYKVQKALMGYFLIKNGLDVPSNMVLHSNDHSMHDFYHQCENRMVHSENNFHEGLREIGLIFRSQKKVISTGTQQDDIIEKLGQFCSDYVSAIGFYLRTYWR